ncbi:tyrosine-protein phosphatase [Paenibacillus sp. D2_2]|uniref:tyrosine-protein phosphatase n=1 Tax=Paenibacillus sp. D2_2 TaxID=3073092 RepID=UPI002814F6AF|nr:tyrosine-protein phosphatase [Paenibacillus sp. D2_2]WMT41327.1 tyrosine-protein phosphatase [Paenibacillus sp. D2_2]
MQRVIALEGAHNFRDMGGYETTDGRKVKYGVFYRSDELSGLSPKDIEMLKSLNIKTIFDYRSNQEAQLKPDPTLPNVIYELQPAIAEDQHHRMNMSFGPEGEEKQGNFLESLAQNDFFKTFRADAYMRELYSKLPLNNASYKRLMEIIQMPEHLGILHHCTAGKDRTGVGAALILLVLGVSEQAVMEDYLLTNETMRDFNQKLLGQIAEHANDAVLNNFSHLLDVKEELMEAVFRTIKENYGTYDAYFAEEFGLTEEKRELLKANSLQ